MSHQYTWASAWLEFDKKFCRKRNNVYIDVRVYQKQEGGVTQGQSVRFACEKPGVRIPPPPNRFNISFGHASFSRVNFYSVF